MIMKNLLLICCAIILSGCSHKAKEKIGLVTTGPDENQVLKNKSLEIPPHYSLEDLPVPAQHKQIERIEDAPKKEKSKGLFQLGKKK